MCCFEDCFVVTKIRPRYVAQPTYQPGTPGRLRTGLTAAYRLKVLRSNNRLSWNPINLGARCRQYFQDCIGDLKAYPVAGNKYDLLGSHIMLSAKSLGARACKLPV